MINLVFFLEEPSAREMLIGVLHRFLQDDIDNGNINIEYLVFEGNRDLEKKLPMKIQQWCKPDSYFLVLRDQDLWDCKDLKERIAATIEKCGKSDRALIRIACRELETFYIGDLKAVGKALQIRGLSSQQERSKYRIPDEIVKPSRELKALTKGLYQKIDGSRRIAPHLSLSGDNRSKSFNALLSGIKKLIDRAC